MFTDTGPVAATSPLSDAMALAQSLPQQHFSVDLLSCDEIAAVLKVRCLEIREVAEIHLPELPDDP